MFLHRHIGSALICLAATLVACTPQAVREAQDVVAQADSLRAEGMMYGREAGDSATLSQAYETLNNIPSSLCPQLSTTFAHACYHYGRLLRERENPAAAMETFIHATHSRTHNYHILGRVYSNMGDICHLAGEFPLSYDMFERSANCFLMNGDTLLYCYGLNNMAFELAEQGKKEEAYTLLTIIENLCNDSNVGTKLTETKAIACKKVQQYDSTIYYINQLSYHDYKESSNLLILAQTYSYLGKKDSAVYYAEEVLNYSPTLEELNNALYILTHDDNAKNKEEALKTSAERSDTQKLLEIRQGKLSQAVQLLEQDINREPDLRWLYAIIATLIIVGTGIGCYVYRKRKKHKLISQQVEDLTAHYQNHHKWIEEEIEANCLLLRSSENMINELAWNNYDNMCRIIDRDFYLLASKLRNKNVLSEPEVCLCILVLLDFDRQRIAHLLHYAQSGIGKFKYRVAQKLGTDSKNLRNFLISMAIDEHNE